MRKFFYPILTLSLGAVLMQSCNNKSSVVLNNEADSINYAYGVCMGYTCQMDLGKMKGSNEDLFIETFEKIAVKNEKVFEGNQANEILQNYIMSMQLKGDSVVEGVDFCGDSVSMALAVFITDLAKTDLEMLSCGSNEDMYIAGFMDYFARKEVVSFEVADKYLTEYLAEMRKIENQKSAENAKEAEKQNKTIMEQLKKDKNLKETGSGLLYREIKVGKGPKPAATDKVRVHYEGTLVDGTVFDSSYDRGEPAEFPLNMVIAGWTEGLQLMPVGSTFELVIPPNLGYGSRPAGTIPANSVLIFKVELLDIIK